MSTVVLLDLNYTLVGNSSPADYGKPFHEQLAGEEYRRWLVDALIERGDHVALITVRPARHARDTLARIEEQLGWQPHEAHFNHEPMLRAPDHKRRVLLERIFPKHGPEVGGHSPSKYLAIESNERTQAMYRQHGIRAIRAHDFERELADVALF